MDTSLFLRKWACRRMTVNGLGIILFQYADWLQQKGYGRNTIHLYTQAVEHFGFWRAKRHTRSQSVQPYEVAEFLNSHLSRCDCHRRLREPSNLSKRPHRLMSMLGCRNPSPQSCEGQGSIGRWLLILISTWRRFADSVRRPGSINGALCKPMEWRFEGKRWDLTKLCFADFVDYVKFRAPRLKPASVGVMMTSLRALVRFLEFAGRCRSGLSQAGPRMPTGSIPRPQMFHPQESVVTCYNAWIVSAPRDDGTSPFFG